MKEIFLKYRLLLGFGAGLVLLLFAYQYKENRTKQSIWEHDPKEELSLMEQADSLKPASHDLKEARFADKLAQEAFTDGKAKPKAEGDSKPDSKSKNKGGASSSSSSKEEWDADAEAAKLLGSKPETNESDEESNPEEGQGDEEKPLAGNSALTKTGMAAGNQQQQQGSSASSHRPPPKPRPRRYGTTPDPRMLVDARGDSAASGAMSSGALETVGKGKTSLTGGNLLKKGAEYVAVINDTIELTPGMKQNVVVHVFGRLSKNTGPSPFQMFATAKMSKNGQSIVIDVNSCLDSAPNTKSIDCKGDVGGLDGKRGLSDDVYSPDMLSAIIKTAGLAASQWSLSNITQSVTDNGVLLDQTQSNALWQTLSGSWQTLANESAANVERQGNRVTLYGQKVVKVLITDDVELW